MLAGCAIAARIREALDSEQAEAVAAFADSALVIASAGSGKTRVLTYGLAHLLEDEGLSADEILLLTFTRKAAETMRERAAAVTTADLSMLRCGTFHAIGARLLREHGHKFTVLDEFEAALMVAQLQAELAYERDAEGLVGLDNERLLGYFTTAREEDVTLLTLLEEAPERYRECRQLIVELERRYAQRKSAEALLDYADVLWETREFLREDKEACAQIKAVLVDEVQDLNSIQREIVREFIVQGTRLVQVGDPQQAIYGFRGASYEALLTAATDPALAICKLTTNYRSTASIVALAQSLLPPTALALAVRSARAGGVAPLLLRPQNPDHEAAVIDEWVRCHHERGVPLEDLCVLARSHEQLQALTRALAAWPFALLGRRRGIFADARRYLLALMRLAEDAYDESAWRLTLTLLGCEVEDREAQLRALKLSANPLLLCVQWVEGESGQRLLQLLDASTPTSWLWERVCLGGFADLIVGNLPEATRAATLLADLVASGSGDGEGSVYVNALTAADDVLGAGVRLGTVHAAKGLEWPHVLIARCSYTAFPSRLSVAEDNLDEERRLFYVALTRAADTLTVCEAPWLGDGGRGRHWADFLEDADVRAHFRKSI